MLTISSTEFGTFRKIDIHSVRIGGRLAHEMPLQELHEAVKKLGVSRIEPNMGAQAVILRLAVWQQEQAEAAEVAQREAAIAAAQARNKANRETRERLAQEGREREVRDLRFKVTQQQAWQRNVEVAAQRQRRQAVLNAEIERRKPIIAAMECLLNPPPEPEDD